MKSAEADFNMFHWHAVSHLL